MLNFKPFGTAVDTQLKSMIASDKDTKNMFIADVSGDELWELYLASFPEGSNPIYIENTVHDCSACRNFVKNLGGVVLIKDGETHTIWDGALPSVVEDAHAAVAKIMGDYVKGKGIRSQFLVTEGAYGSGRTGQFDHFYARVPRSYQMKNSNDIGARKTDVSVTKRSLESITEDAIQVTLELISQNSIYRGAEFKGSVNLLQEMKKEYDALGSGRDKDIYLWTKASGNTRFRNTAIGTLLVDISDGVPVDRAVASFESKVAPENYQRPAPVVTEKMIQQAMTKAEELGIHDALFRKHAKREDINVKDVLFADNQIKPQMLGGIFETLKPNKIVGKDFTGKVAEVSLEKFLGDVLPKTEAIELLLENSMKNNFVSLVAPVHSEAAPIFKWSNGFSWSYDGEVTDSIAQRVKKAGGRIDADVRVSMSWHNSDDMDLSIKHDRSVVYYSRPQGFGAHLDVDTNGLGASNHIDPVENITWKDKDDMPQGSFEIWVHQFSKQSTTNAGYEVEVEILGDIYTYESQTSLRNDVRQPIGTLIKDREGNITLTGDKLKRGGSTQEKWGVTTSQWIPVDMIMKSPNHWDDSDGVGNEHVFFMLAGCKNPEPVRGFYNEFLRSELRDHRRVFELLASQARVEYSDEQLSGVGFSTTQGKEITLRVKGATNRIIKVLI